MPNKRTGMDYLDYSGLKPKKKKGPVASPKHKAGPVNSRYNPDGTLKKKKKKKDTRYNPFNDGRTPTSASHGTGP